MAKKIVVEGEPKEVTDIRNKILKEFKDLTFIEEGHKYFLNGQQLPSVSEVTHRFCQYPFNEKEQAERYAEKHGETAQYWLDQWKFTNLKATTSGTPSSFHWYLSPKNKETEYIIVYREEDRSWVFLGRNDANSSTLAT